MASESRPDKPAAWQKLNESEVFSCRIFSILKRRMRSEQSVAEDDFFALDSPDWVLILPVTAVGELVLVRQYRFAGERFGWEIPGGVMDPGESPRQAGERELREETGYQCDDFVDLGHSWPNPAIQTNRAWFLLARDVKPTGQTQWDEHEEMEIATFPHDKVTDMVRSGAIHHALCHNALYLYQLWLGQS